MSAVNDRPALLSAFICQNDEQSQPKSADAGMGSGFSPDFVGNIERSGRNFDLFRRKINSCATSKPLLDGKVRSRSDVPFTSRRKADTFL